MIAILWITFMLSCISTSYFYALYERDKSKGDTIDHGYVILGIIYGSAAPLTVVFIVIVFVGWIAKTILDYIYVKLIKSNKES